MAQLIHSHRLEKELQARDLVPTGCRFMSLVIEAGRPIVITLQKYPNDEELQRLGDAIKAASAPIDDVKP
jgi:hypothetical protein